MRESLDGASDLPLFEGVIIIDTEENLGFSVPERYINTSKYGKFILEIDGDWHRFKERDDYGAIRTTQSGKSLWIPHLYPFEETDERGLPLILDRERCKLHVSLQLISGHTNISPAVSIQTPQAKLTANQGEESYNGSWKSYFNEFELDGTPLRADFVAYPKRRWHLFVDYVNEMNPTMTSDDFMASMLGKLPFPDEFLNQDRPDNWQARPPADLIGTAFGSVWVPIDDLRRGIDAAISFPCFKGE